MEKAGGSMGRTSNAVKQRWNEGNYTQLKVWVPPGVAAAFKAKCKACNISMAGELTRFMNGGADQGHAGKGAAPVIATRPQRRRAVEEIVQGLHRVLEAENEYIDSMPPGIRESVRREAADEAVGALEEALEALGRAY